VVPPRFRPLAGTRRYNGLTRGSLLGSMPFQNPLAGGFRRLLVKRAFSR